MGLYLVLHDVLEKVGMHHIYLTCPLCENWRFLIFKPLVPISIWQPAIQTRDTWLGRTINARGFLYDKQWKTEIWFSIALIQFKPFNSKAGLLPFQGERKSKGTLHSTWAPLQTNRAEKPPRNNPLGTACRAGGYQLPQDLQDLLQQLPLGCPAEWHKSCHQ